MPPITKVQKPRSKTDADALNQLILRSIVDHAIVTIDQDGIVTSWNDGAEKILGWREEEIVGRPAEVFFTPQDREADRPATEMQLAREKGRAEDERWHVRKGGERFWGSGLMMPLLTDTDAAGNAAQEPSRPAGFMKIFRDRTVEREATGKLNRLETRAALALRNSGTAGVYDYDILEGIVAADAVCAGFLSVDPELAAGGAPIDNFFDGIDAEDRATVRAGLERTAEAGDDFDETYRIIATERWPRWVHSQGSVQRDGDGRAARLSGIITEITGQRRQAEMQQARLDFGEAVRGIRDAREIARHAAKVIVETLYATRAGHGLIDLDGDTIDVEADYNLSDAKSLVGRLKYSDFGSFASVLHEGDTVVISDTRNDPRVKDPAALESIGVRSLVNLPLIERGRLKAVLFVNDDRPRQWSADELAFMQGIFDRTYAAIDRARYESERDVMTAELAHRMKNMLTIAQVVVTQSLRHKPELEPERRAIAARLNALSAAQDILTHGHNQDADIHTVVATAVAPHRTSEERITLEGPRLALTSQQVLGLALSLHELATNASKYGALSTEAGRVAIVWAVDRNAFTFTWVETGGPQVSAPRARGFGSTILDRVAGRYFDGSSGIEFAPGGVVFRIEGPWH